MLRLLLYLVYAQHCAAPFLEKLTIYCLLRNEYFWFIMRLNIYGRHSIIPSRVSTYFISAADSKVIKELEWPWKMSLCRVFLIKIYGVGQGRDKPWWTQLPSRMRGGPNQVPPAAPLSYPIRYIPEIFIKNILQNDIFPGHSSSLMTLEQTTFRFQFHFFKPTTLYPIYWMKI